MRRTLSMALAGTAWLWTGSLSMRRKIYWWFRFVISGRFLETFLNLRDRGK